MVREKKTHWKKTKVREIGKNPNRSAGLIYGEWKLNGKDPPEGNLLDQVSLSLNSHPKKKPTEKDDSRIIPD